MPIRIQITGSSEVPETVLYVGSGTKWNNHFKAGEKIGFFLDLRLNGNQTLIHTIFVLSKSETLTQDYIFYLKEPFLLVPNNAEAVRLFKTYQLPLYSQEELYELRGKDLACCCNLNETCHADILLEAANGK